ncbi:MAG: YcbK family protein [Sphingomonadales bacterium]
MDRDNGLNWPTVCRRSVLSGLTATAFLALPMVRVAPAAMPERRLRFFNIHTGERVEAVYHDTGGRVPEALAEINHVLRDWRTSEVAAIDPTLLDFLHVVKTKLATDAEFHVISGYRSPKTNAKLASKSNAVAKKSLHMQGRAIDVAIPGFSVAEVSEVALSLKLGGVGSYSKSGFVHLDTGRFRRWGS